MKLLAAALSLTAFTALADEPPKMSPEDQKMMEKYMKAATPGPEHQAMAKMAGKWKLQVTSWMKPGAPPMKSEATAEYRAILGGRYLEQEVHGDMGGAPFEGRGIEGYDNVTRTRFASWVDNMATSAPMVTRGKCAVTAKTCTLKGKFVDPIAGKEMSVTETVTVTDDNNFRFEMAGPGPDGKPYKSLEIVYTRAQ
ncbi:MAG TPA: DUF1579 domain-containing protein [Myxococcales bacterium]|nr:DUF1579 domain-containing protein [Myxococcales bacterium]